MTWHVLVLQVNQTQVIQCKHAVQSGYGIMHLAGFLVCNIANNVT